MGSDEMRAGADGRFRLAEISKTSSGYAEYALKAECAGLKPLSEETWEWCRALVGGRISL